MPVTFVPAPTAPPSVAVRKSTFTSTFPVLLRSPPSPPRRARLQAAISPRPAPAIEIAPASTPLDRDAAFNLWARMQWEPDDADDDAGTVTLLARRRGQLVGAARLSRSRNNAEFSRIFVEEDARGQGVGRALLNQLLRLARETDGAIFVDATRNELGFFSILGFETQGTTFMHEATHQPCRHMVFKAPVCSPAAGQCIGLHHTALRVLDIERSLAWYGSIGFTVDEKYFTPAGQRACFVEGLGIRIELMESTTGAGVSGVQDIPGFLVFDVTRGCRDLETFLEHLKKRNGGYLDVRDEPAHEVIGANLLSSVIVEDPDGIGLKFVRREGNLSASLLRPVDW